MCCPAQADILTILHDDALQHLCLTVAQKYISSPSPARTRELIRRMTAPGARGTVDHHALRSSCKPLQRCSDAARPSIYFRAEEQDDVGPYLRKLPSIQMVSIPYSTAACAFQSSLASLHSILPALTFLKLQYAASRPATLEARNAVPRLSKSLLLAWNRTLQSLHLTSFNFAVGSEGGRDANEQGLGFLRSLPVLKVLQLHDVTPSLRSEDIVHCTRLRELAL